ncbi:hypothetical protein BTUL_0081g00330 [Botrytis tulipae]|uniref:BTB domain-containing protein n=1 Tax=Botrytis tulipae TaxID=87230 RepID=A0A4Z1EKD1_9HELO|nr:hypothetical protein BTUL_0081g00330 [Botrytis tulipae]
MENQEHLFVFEDGDVRAKAKHGERIITFKLSSHALCFASPVWKKFVFPPFPLLSSLRNEEEPNSKKACAVPEEPFPDIELDFTEDNPEALLILLQIAHLKFSNVPSQLPYEVLYHIAILCDQYDCRKLVKPWIQGWLKDEANEAYLPQYEGWLFMLFDPPYFAELYPLDLEGSPLPLEITDFMKGLLNGNVNDPCKELCPLAMYGLMSKHLSERNLWPLPRTEDYDLTPYQLYKKVVRALHLSSVAHKPMENLHISRSRTGYTNSSHCYFTDDWRQLLLLQSKDRIGRCDVHWNEGETGIERFQKFMDHAVEEVGNFDFHSEPLPGGALDSCTKEILELFSMKSSK